ncbi:MAG: SPFH domain-containing protein [Planctomycetota bacterium]
MEQQTATALHLERLERTRRVAGWIALLLALPLCLATFSHWVFAADPLATTESGWIAALLAVVLPGGGFGALVLVACFSTWRMLAWRVRTLRVVTTSAGTERRALAAPLLGTRLFPLLTVLQHVAFVATGLGSWIFLRELLSDAAPPTRSTPGWFAFLPDAAAASGLVAAERTWQVWVGVAHLALGAAAALVATWFESVDRELAPEARGVACWLRVATWYGLVAGAPLVAAGLLPEYAGALHLAAIRSVLDGFVAVLWFELLLRALAATWARFYSGVANPGASVWTDAVVPRLLGSSFNPVRSVFGVAADGFGIDLRGTYALDYMRRALLPIAAALVAIVWLSTSLRAVPEWSVGVLERFGKRPTDGGLLEPGLHVLLPWPFDRVREVEVARVQSTPVGYERAIAGASLLWTKAHAEREYRLVLGDGDELLSINGVLHWRPSDPLAFVYGTADPVAALRDVADGVLLEATRGLRLGDVLEGDVAALTDRFERRIREEVERRGLGIEIVDFAVLGLHPPLDVAADYQSVVSAQIDRERFVVEAETDAESKKIAADADAHEQRTLAEIDAVNARSEGLAQVEATASVVRATTHNEATVRLVLQLQRLAEVLRGQPYYLFDSGLGEAGASFWYLTNDR